MNVLENVEVSPFAPPPKRGVPAGLAKGDGMSKRGINLGGWIPFALDDVDEVEGPDVPAIGDDAAEGDAELRVEEGEVGVGLSATVVAVGVAGSRG